LAALQGIEGVGELLGAEEMRPAGIFFVNLSGKYESASNRTEALANSSDAHKLAFKHHGRFDAEALEFLDKRGADAGDQFAYRRKINGELRLTPKGPMPSAEFQRLLETTEKKMREFGRRIYEGDIQIDPYKLDRERACEHCEHAAICRIDPWTHQFRNLKNLEEQADD